MKIVIAGIGGVGGYFGGLLARHYHQHDEVTVSFFARGNHRRVIAEKGLLVKKGNESWVAFPHTVTDDAHELGTADVLIVASKSYSLEMMLQQLTPCVDSSTIMLPLLNGADSFDRVQHYFPFNTVLHGCVYLVSRKVEDGVIETSGNVESLFFGIPLQRSARCIELESIFKRANIQATCTPVIEQVVWEKFLFVSPIATATTFYNDSIGNILSNVDKRSALLQLVKEIHALADAKGIGVPTDLSDRTIARLGALPYDTTSSMQADYVQGHTIEWKSLMEYVIVQSRLVGLEAPMYTIMLNHLVPGWDA